MRVSRRSALASFRFVEQEIAPFFHADAIRFVLRYVGGFAVATLGAWIILAAALVFTIGRSRCGAQSLEE